MPMRNYGSGLKMLVVIILSGLMSYFLICWGADRCGFESIPSSYARPSNATGSNTAAQNPDHLVRLEAGRMIVKFDRRTGTLFSINEKEGRFGTNYIGNPENNPGTSASAPFWTGNVVSTVWELESPERPLVMIPSFSFRPSGKWRKESTGRSQDTRKVAFDGRTLQVDYVGRSANEGGLHSYDLRMAWKFADDKSLLWEMEVENTTGRILEIGEFGFPLAINDNNRSVRQKNPYTNTVDDKEVLYEDERIKLTEQPIIHEKRVTGHHYVGGHSSYSLVQRLLGDPPFLLIHPVGDTAFECQYRFEDSLQGGRRQRRPTVLAVHSWAVKRQRRWVNGHTSLILKPGEKRSYRLRFKFVDGYTAVRDEIARSGNIGIRIVPSMVVPEDNPVYLELRSSSDPEVSFLSDNCRILERKRLADRTLLTLAFRGRGQKSVRLTWAECKWTNIHFYCTEDTAELIKARARFIVERQFYENPEDPYNRHHMFLPFDYRTGSIFSDSDSVWEVGGSDEYGFAEPLFLAEKNVYYPVRREVETLEAYVNDCLMKHIQNQETFAVRASLYWKERYPSSPWGHWTEERSKESYRTYNYPHVANIYHALYRIGKRYELTSRKAPLDYLRLAYNTCIKWFSTGPWKHVGVMGGSNALEILEDLKREGWDREYETLKAELQACNDVFVQTPYPYSSELYVDQTAHEHVALFTRAFGTPEKYRKTLQVIQALRGGNQPVWFRYGNDNRGDSAGWYTVSLNGIPLLKGFEESGDREMFVQGYAGVMLVTANLLADGMGFARFSSAPGVFTFNPLKTSDGGIGMYGYLKGAKAYVMTDEAFGLIGCGAKVEVVDGVVHVTPTDGLRKRLLLVDDKIDVEAVKGELESLTWNKNRGSLELNVTDSTGLVDAAEIIVLGLDEGNYVISFGRSSEIRASTGSLILNIPIQDTGTIKIERKKKET